MDIGIIGSGNIGSTAARHFVDAGHDVAISNSRGPGSLDALVDDLGPNARAATVEDAAAFGDVVLEAIPFAEYESLPADALANTTVISASNYYPDRDGEIDLDGLTETEAVAEHLPDARVIKAFNTMDYETLRDESRPEADPADRLVLFVAGDDALAKATVVGLIEDIGFAAVDLGRLTNGQLMEPGSRIYGEPMTLTEAESLLENLTF
ncbi:NAD(P)-binding domain-containing protein [Halorubellus sp. JP-L1]|uniref:NADPH-dependent F420 reductase n=1 Tax=Halorubellus sp. JP-L1 TaxID=2715753 RepID=UPI00140CBF88|nr:NAD(P)-binding domain-containing protein [Halorubellus sp. JP-L1]NHN41403.1 NAD(P)-binding domain-containing protein [Halorubellus sp. JP-L1]